MDTSAPGAASPTTERLFTQKEVDKSNQQFLWLYQQSPPPNVDFKDPRVATCLDCPNGETTEAVRNSVAAIKQEIVDLTLIRASVSTGNVKGTYMSLPKPLYLD